MFEKAALCQLQLEDSELQNDVTELLNHLRKQDSGWSSWNFGQVVKCLGSYSLIECDHQNCTYSIHPLVQHWSGTTMKENRLVMQKCVLTIIGLSISQGFSNGDYKYRHTLLQHISNLRALLNPEEILPSVLDRIAHFYFKQGQWKEAEVLVVAVMEKRKQVLGDNHPQTLVNMGNLADIYRKQGHWKEAEILQVVVMEKMKWVLGNDYPDTLLSMDSLASTYMDQGRWKEAELLEVVVMKKMKQVFGDDHPFTIMSMGNLACTYRNQGQHQQTPIFGHSEL